jgi:hypothetical protein
MVDVAPKNIGMGICRMDSHRMCDGKTKNILPGRGVHPLLAALEGLTGKFYLGPMDKFL